MSFNRFLAGSESAPTGIEEEDEIIIEDESSIEEESSEASVDPVTGKKKRRKNKPRDPNKKNVSIDLETKKKILKRYFSESPAEIARDMGLEARQVYNIVRNTRLKLEASLKACDTSTEEGVANAAKLEEAISKLPHKEFGGGAAGNRSNALTQDDILATLLS